RFLYAALGTALGRCRGRELLRAQLRELLESGRGHRQPDREGLAWCFGICARNHLEETLEKLEEFVKSEAFRKSQGLFSIFKERSEAEQDKQRAAMFLLFAP
ncbi:maestro heat-like repeat-containing protein family member 1, partial [Camarhynchus parvulus]|uniref:maestro heat-like repeat-containing protein family member 1 n=1 Tax=Geospiza parvula TaxID=87175 RepID=UPI00123830A1